MNEYDRELLNEFVVESSELLERVEETLLGIDDRGSLDPEAINEIFRAVHSVKGTSGFFGLEVIGRLSHIMENVLGGMRDGRFTPEPSLIDLLLKSNDRLRALVADPEASHGADVSSEVASLEQWLNPGKEAAAPAPKAAPEAPAAPAAADIGGTPFVMTEELEAEIRRHGLSLYRLDLSVQEDIVARKRSMTAFFGHLATVGTIVHCAPSKDDLLALDPTVEHSFSVWLSTVLDPDLAPMGLALPADRINALSVDEISAGKEDAAPGVSAAPAAPAAAAPAASAAAPAPAAVAAAPEAPAAPAAPEEAPEDLLAAASLVAELPDPPAAEEKSRPEVKRSGHLGQSDTLRVKTSLLDRLMQMAGELVLTRNRLLRRLDAERSQLDGIGGILNELNGITSEMQEQIMQTRLQPIGSIFGRFGRVVHDMSKKLGKSVRLETVGSDVELDKAILEGLADPLTHMLRNSIDHGLESPDDREAAGKPRQGIVWIRAYHEGGMVKIDVEDDGRGIDLEKVKLAAMRRGILTSEQAAKMTEGDALNLIFRPGFSTAQKITDVSGRGVGMDVVRTNIEKLGGVVEASTKKGEGSRLSIKLPLTLAIVTSLIVEVEQQRFALPQVGLESVVRLRPEEVAERIERIRDMDVLRYRERLLPIVRLSDVLGIPRTYIDPDTGERVEDRRGRLSDRRQYARSLGDEEREKREGSDRREALANVLRILVLRIGRHSYGLVVDTIVENEEIVVKPLSRFLRDCNCFSGATILGDGTIAMILDPVNIAQAANLTFSDLARELSDRLENEHRASSGERVPLIHFSNGGPETFAIPLAQVCRVESISHESVQRVGHKEYINYRGAALPLVRLHEHLDVAMPMEEPEELKVIIPNLPGDAAGIVTHKIIDAREMDLNIDETTISGQGLIGSAIMGEDIVLVVDTYGLMESAGVNISGPDERALAGRKVLLVEDTPFVRRATENYLAGVGVNVDTVGDGKQAWEMIQSGGYDLVITDLGVPELDGTALLAKIRETDELAGLPVVALAEEGAKDGQFDAYAPKLDRPELMAAITAVLAHAREEAAA